jgi:hypothetical protein
LAYWDSRRLLAHTFFGLLQPAKAKTEDEVAKPESTAELKGTAARKLCRRVGHGKRTLKPRALFLFLSFRQTNTQTTGSFSLFIVSSFHFFNFSVRGVDDSLRRWRREG